MVSARVLVWVWMGFCPMWAWGQTTVPHEFQDGEVIEASEFNDNFEALEAAIDGISAGPKGDKGDKGDTGVGIQDISFTSTTDTSGNPAQPGATDTYTVAYTDASEATFTVVNGADLTNSDLIDNTSPSDTTTYSSNELENRFATMDTGDMSNDRVLGDVTVPTGTNRAFLTPATFNSITVQDGARLKLI